MPYLGSWKIDDLLTFPAITHAASTGALTDADAVPSYRVYEDETGTAILTGSMAKLDDANTTGFYSEQITLSAANGFEKGKCYTVYITAAVSSVTGGQTHTFQVQAEVAVASMNADVVTASAIAANAIGASEIADGAIDAATFAANAITATVIADGAIDAATFAANAITATVIADGAIDAATFAANAITSTVVADNTITANKIASDAITAAKIADNAIDNATFAADTGKKTIRSNTAQSGAATTITLDASASAVDDFYNNAIIYLTGGTGAGQARFISDYVGATKVATVSTWATNPDNTSTFAIIPFGAIPGATAPTAAEVADAVWEEAIADHSGTAGSVAEALDDASAGGGGGGGGMTLNTVLENGLTVGEVLRIMLAAMAGESPTPSSGVRTYLSVDGNTVRISATVSNGDRSNVELDGT